MSMIKSEQTLQIGNDKTQTFELIHDFQFFSNETNCNFENLVTFY